MLARIFISSKFVVLPEDHIWTSHAPTAIPYSGVSLTFSNTEGMGEEV